MRHTPWKGALAIALALTLALIMVACGGEDDEDEEESDDVRPVASSTVTPSTATTPSASTAPSSATSTTVASGLPAITTQADVMFVDLATGKIAFEVEVENEYGETPVGSIEPLEAGRSLEESIRANLRRLADQGYTEIEMYVVEGYGNLYLKSQVLEALRHQGFDYDSQYEDGELIVDEDEAKQRYYSVGDIVPMVVREAHALGIEVTGLIESLGHIINRAADSGIGSSGELIISGHLPPPSIEQVLAFIDEVIATGIDAVSAEAFPADYDLAIASHLASRGIPYVHTGADLGTIWMGYYYSFYPDVAVVRDVYSYLHTADALVGTTNGTIYARARALSPKPETGLVVGGYLPLPCDTELSVADLYSLNRSDPEALLVDMDAPALADGTLVDNCATGPWRNFILLATRRQGVNRILLTADVDASIAASSDAAILREITERLTAHPATDSSLPVANIIIDLPTFAGEDGTPDDDFRDEFLDALALSTVGVIDDALQAAGYQTVLTYERPWQGGVSALTYILTAGGNEATGDFAGSGPPYWTGAEELEPALLELLDPALHPGPVFIHPLLGIPDSGNWQGIRNRFGLTARFSYANTTLSSDEEYHISLLTSLPVDSDGEVAEDASQDKSLTPETGSVLGQTMHLAPYADFYRLGEVANFVGSDEVMPGNVFAEGPLLVPSGGSGLVERNAPYLVSDGQGRFLWLVSQLHHEATNYIVGQAIAQATGKPAVLVAPAMVHLWSGTQTFALAYARTQLSLRLPFEPGQLIDITIYDLRSNPVLEQRGVPYQEPLEFTLEKYSLLVVEPTR